MQTAAVPVFLTFAIITGLAVALLVMSRLLTPRQFIGPVQKMPYESGMDPIHDTRRRFDVRFHLIAIAFLVFDVEILFLYPWAVATKRPEAAAATQVVDEQALVEAKTAAPLASTEVTVSAVPAAAATPIAATDNLNDKPYGISAAVDHGLATDRDLVFGGAMVFFVLLGLGFIYDWRKGVFQWR